MEIIELLDSIKKRPGHFLGVKSIVKLEMFLNGFIYAKQVHEGRPPVEEPLLVNFTPWIKNKYGIKTEQSWMQVILFFSADEFDAFDNFFNLLDDFLGHRRA